jgi:hypothetical protein
MKMFTLIHLNNKSTALITTKTELEKIYQPKFPVPKYQSFRLLCKKNQGEKLVDSVKIQVVADFNESVNWIKNNPFNQYFTLLHTSLQDLAVKNNDHREEKLMSLDKAIAEIYSLQPINSFLIVVFGGTKDSLQNGTCLMKIKSNTPKI